MCKYCDPFSSENLITDGFSVFVGEGEDAIAEVFITSEQKLELYTEYHEIELIRKIVPINYCPMCGRKLSSN